MNKEIKTCKDCLHHTVCLKVHNKEKPESALDCIGFDPKSEWKHINYSIGDKVYKYAVIRTPCSLGEIPNDCRCSGCEQSCDSEEKVELFEGVIYSILINEDDIYAVIDWNHTFYCKNACIGKDAFLTREEAEKNKPII